MEIATWQPSLLSIDPDPGQDPVAGGSDVGVDIGVGTVGRLPNLAAAERLDLTHGAWLDHLPGWLPGADELFATVVDGMDWQQGTERIRGEEVRRPRLTAHRDVADLTGDLAVLGAAGEALSARYEVAFTRVGVNLYRDGRDSVAWHGDRVARDLPTATIAIVSLGQARGFRARPAEGGPSLGFELGHGDLLVMGGSFQRTWRHAVPKVAAAGPRCSVTFRHPYPTG